ncbi:MAG: ABC transporter permease subunit [Bacteroidota bacterium]|jgi:ABC-2 type transport system permease protein
MIRLIYYELVKIFLKKRTYLGFGIVLAIVPLVEVAMKLEGGRFLTMAMRGLSKDFLFFGNIFNGWFVAYQIMNSLWFHIPLLISFVAGDQLAGEATAGTYRLILIRPVSRSRIFISKFITTLIYTITFVFFLAALSIGLALALLGRGDLIIVTRGILLLPESEVAWRFLIAYLLATWTMITIASISFFFSSFVENAIGPIVATMGLLIVCTVITVMPVEMFEIPKKFLFTRYLDMWQKIFLDPIPWSEVKSGILYMGAWTLAAALGAWGVFVKKDILS